MLDRSEVMRARVALSAANRLIGISITRSLAALVPVRSKAEAARRHFMGGTALATILSKR